MTLFRASLALLSALIVAAHAALPARAQDYPSKPIKIIVPTAPAGIGDQVARLMQQKLAEGSKAVTIVVENRAGEIGRAHV